MFSFKKLKVLSLLREFGIPLTLFEIKLRSVVLVINFVSKQLKRCNKI